LTYRIAYLLSQGVPAGNILALTFTNKAAREMKERIQKLVGNDARYLWMGTFHSICAKLLRHDAEKLGFTRDFTIYDTSDSKSVIKAICKERGLDEKQIVALDPVFSLNGSAQNKLAALEGMFASVEVGRKGVEELKTLFGYIEAAALKCDVELDLTLARGLNYYTGAIFEVKAKDVQIGSICGGGRYDNLTGIFGMPDVSGVGISFGADRIYDVLTELNAFPADLAQAATVFFINFGPVEQAACVALAARLRAEGIATLIYPDSAKMKKQMEFANRKGIPYVAFVGESEIKDGTVTLKNMQDGTQETLTVDKMIEKLK
jgi:histidyl-tRNA synthetase